MYAPPRTVALPFCRMVVMKLMQIFVFVTNEYSNVEYTRGKMQQLHRKQIAASDIARGSRRSSTVGSRRR